MILTQSSSLWGVVYRHRYYVDGRRVPDAEFARLWSAAERAGVPIVRLRHVRTSGKYRSDWELSGPLIIQAGDA